MTLFIDADACPVVRLAIDIAKSFKLDVCLIFDNTHVMTKYENIPYIICDKGADSADIVLANRLSAGDIALTQDYGVAAMALAKKCYAINQNGLVFTDENIDALLFSRHIGKKLRQAGKRTKGPSKRTRADDERFTAALKTLLSGITGIK